MKYVIMLFAAVLIALILYIGYNATNDYKAKIEHLKRQIENYRHEIDSLELQINARHDLIKRQENNIADLTNKNRKIRIEYAERIKAVSTLNATQQLDLFSELIGD